MRPISRILLAAGPLAIAASHALAQGTPLYGISVGGYFPTDGEIRDLVGKSFLQLGFSPNVGVSKEKFSLRPELVYIGGSGHGNRFSIFAIPITAVMPLSLTDQKTTPYIAAGAGLTYFDYDITRPGPTNFRRSGVGAITHFEAGMVFGDRVKLSARYNILSGSQGFNFNGIQVGISWQFFSL
jgi:hypothetical protein